MIPYRRTSARRSRPACSGFPAILILSLFWNGPAASALAAEPEPSETYRSPSEGIVFLRAEPGTLSLDVRDAPLERILQEISRLADVTITADGPLQGKVTLRAEKLPLDTALKKLLKGRDMTCLYGPEKASGAPERYRLQSVRIYLEEGKEGSGRLYSYAREPASTDRTRKPDGTPRMSRTREVQPEPAPPPAPPPPPPPPVGGIRSPEEAKRFMTEILRGNPEQLDDIVERLKRENPEVQEQIDQFLESIEEAQKRARETGRPFPALGDLGELGSLLQQTPGDQPDSEEKDDETDEP